LRRKRLSSCCWQPISLTRKKAAARGDGCTRTPSPQRLPCCASVSLAFLSIPLFLLSNLPVCVQCSSAGECWLRMRSVEQDTKKSKRQRRVMKIQRQRAKSGRETSTMACTSACWWAGYAGAHKTIRTEAT
jgi:hypothetical protein